MKKDSVVKLQVPIVRLVIKDLITLDGLKLQTTETNKLLELSNDKLTLKDSVITSLNSKVLNLEEIVNKQNTQFGLEREKSQSLEVEIQQQKRKTFWWKVATGAGLVLSIIFAASGN